VDVIDCNAGQRRAQCLYSYLRNRDERIFSASYRFLPGLRDGSDESVWWPFAGLCAFSGAQPNHDRFSRLSWKGEKLKVALLSKQQLWSLEL
jgi:hypothetical protein